MHMIGPGACWDRAYEEALTTPAWHQAGWLLDTIGPRFTAAGVGVTDARTVRRWRDDHTESRDHSERARLQPPSSAPSTASSPPRSTIPLSYSLMGVRI